MAWIGFGLFIFVLLVAGIFVGLKVLSKPEKRTEADFERNAAESTSMLGAGMGALQDLMGSGSGEGERSKDANERGTL